MTPAQGIRISSAVILALLSGMASWLLLTLVRAAGGSYPVISWLGLVPLVAVIVLVLVLSWQVRRYVRGADPSRPRPSPQRARSTLVGAQAAALGGAALVGWYTANALAHLPNADVPGERTQLLWGLAHAVVALALSASGFVGQAWCRIPPTEHGDDDDGAVPDGDLAYG
ncbi:hypothetical protein GCM10009584_14720 [Ornithinimicrobium humiphilum]|uniref:Uncharacterized protein DUF3180 n=1 Tax=Ornithinimicrobium humiphilum TaxID=125288 RepID=A0A543KKI7_9MICO|nr:DUF3180 domain-containing protein [Ornithinimicrobium humiphilum]TQM95564.1 uncharacterized protein DUF3180 [Ornithinimicrobium humiphilum]